MSRTVVDTLSRIVDRRSSRRGFLSKSAMGATAIAVAPAAYVLRPTTAHAAICSCQGLDCDCLDGCCDGYTDFCCFLSGENLCPPGTIVAGWWKADGSGFCDIDGPRPRYYLDCNLPCDDGCGCDGSGVCESECTSADCRCAGGDCHSRAVDCTRFRYGQCNQHVPCVGPIACRIITCVPPWDWDPSCTTEVATDNNTRFHDRPCLHDGFTDIAPNAWYTESVHWMLDEGLTTGFTDDLFGPREPATRAHIATFLWRYVGRPVPSAPAPFTDVVPGSFYEDAVTWMAAEGITTGTSPTTFTPDRLITRAETITFLWRAAGEPSGDSGHGFVDVEPSDFYARAVAWAKDAGITQGTSATEFSPDQDVDRAQIAAFLFRYHRNVVLGVPG
ncbi:MAG: S-layer homology domain-containing protein [Actinomycetota bacterium]